MQDQIISGTGNSRFLKSSIPADITFEQMVAMLRNGTFPIDLNGINAAGMVQTGTALNKANLLSDATSEELFGDEDDHTVDEALREPRKTYVTAVTKDDMTTETSLLSVGRSMLSASTDGGGNVLFGGGFRSIGSAAVDKYTTSGTTSTLTNLSVGRAQLAASTDGDGNVLFGGGNDYASSGVSAVVDKYTSSGIKSTLNTLSAARTALSSSTNSDGNVLFGGGFASAPSAIVDQYMPNETKSTLTSLSAARYFLAASTDGGGNVLFGGGSNSSDGSGASTVSSVDKYTPSGTRSTLTSLSVARSQLAAASDGNGRVLFGGGSNGSSPQSTVDCYTVSGTRSTLTALSVARSALAASTDGDGRVLFGGGQGGGVSNVVDCYATDGTRTTLTALSAARYSLASSTDGNGNVLFGGGSNNSAVVDKYMYITYVSVPAYSNYKFVNNYSEQSTIEETTVTVPTNTVGYFYRMTNVSI